MKTNHQGGNEDREVTELQGYLELGMQRECLALAGRLLHRHELQAGAFAAAVEAILIQADSLHRWRLRVEAAHARLEASDHAAMRSLMLGLYVSLEDWLAAARFVSSDTEDPLQLLFGMWTMLNLRRQPEAAQLYLNCREAWNSQFSCSDHLVEDELGASSLVEAVACYSAQVGSWGEAEELWQMGTMLRPFAPNAWEGLLKLHTLRALKATQAALEAEATEDWLFADDPQLQLQFLSGRDTPKRKASGLRFARFESHLAKVVPESERFRFNAERP